MADDHDRAASLSALVLELREIANGLCGDMRTDALCFATAKLRPARLQKIDVPKSVSVAGVILAGGALRTIIDEKDEIADYDLFFKTAAALEACRAALAELGELVFECPEGRLFTYKVGEQKFQCIVNQYFADGAQVIAFFDFYACSAALDFELGVITVLRPFVRDVSRKYLHISRVTYPVATFKRIMKYHDKGYFVTEAIKEYALALNPELEGDALRFYID